MNQPPAPPSAKPEIALQIPSDAEYVRVVRLAVIGVASRMAFSYDDIEDIKLAVSEACNNAILHAQVPTEHAEQKATTEAFLAADAESLTEAAVSLGRQEHGAEATAPKPPIVVRLSPLVDRLEISVEDGGQVASSTMIKRSARKPFETPTQTELPEGGMGLFLIESLMDEVHHQSGAGSNTVIHMTKYLPHLVESKALDDKAAADKAASQVAASSPESISSASDAAPSDAAPSDAAKTASPSLFASGAMSQHSSS